MVWKSSDNVDIFFVTQSKGLFFNIFDRDSAVHNHCFRCSNKIKYLHFLVVTHCTPFHRGLFCQFLIWWIYYYGSNKSNGKETGKKHLCAAYVLYCRLTDFLLSKSTYCAAPDEATSEVDSSFLGTFTSRRFGTLQGSSFGLEQGLFWKSTPYKEFYFQILHISTGIFFSDCLNNYFLDKESKLKHGNKKCLAQWLKSLFQ